MTDLLPRLAALTLGGSAAVLVLALAARLSRASYSARWRCWVWLILCLRLAVPLTIPVPQMERPVPSIQISVPSDRVIYSYRPQPVEPSVPGPQTQPVPVPDPGQTPPAPVPPVLPAEPAEPVTTPVSITFFDAAGWVWAAGVLAVLGWYALSHLRFLAYLRRWGGPVVNAQTVRLYEELGALLGLHRRPELLLCSGLAVPMLAGVLRPRLLLPEGELGEEALRCSLLHELTHHRRRDIWLKSAALLAAAVHWFNPLMWYMNRLVERDAELACDEAALKLLSQEERSVYGRTLVDAVGRIKARR